MKCEPVQPYRMTNEIVNRLSTQILKGEIPPGAQLPGERELASRFRVSRPTLGKALHVLEALGLVEVRSGGGTSVSENPTVLSPRLLKHMLSRDKELMLELIATRREFESTNAELAAKNGTESDLVALDKCLLAMAADVEHGGEGFKQELNFHLGVAETTHNRVRLFITTSMLLSYLEIREQARQQMIQRDAQLAEDFVREHRRIYQAIRARNAKRAKAAMKAHLDAAHERYLAIGER